MNFPIQSRISPTQYGPLKTAVLLIISGNAGNIPNSFQYAIRTDDGQNCDVGTSQMTDEQWDAWKDQENGPYIMECLAENLGLELLPDPEPKPATTRKTRR